MSTIIKSSVLTSMALLTSTSLYGAGYMVQENNIFHGQAFAGRAAIADSSSLFWNAAVSGFMTKNEMSAYGNYLRPHSKLKSQSGTSTILQSSPNKNGAKSAFVPALYAVYKVTDKVKLGMAVTAPFGLITDYGNNWMGRYVSTRSDLKTANLNPSLSYKVNDKVAIAGGIVFQHIRADLRNNINQVLVPAPDATVKLKGKDWGYGYNLGFLVEPRKGTRVGLAYRSAIKHKLKGHVTVANVSAPFTTLGSPYYRAFLQNGSINTKLKTPAVTNLSVSQDLNTKWTVLGDIMWTQWKAFKTLSINQTSINYNAAFVEEQHWRNTFMYSLGLNYKYNDTWLFRLGGAYEQTPTRNKYRSTRLPDGNRWWSAGGFDYTINQHSVLRLAYTHIFAKTVKINQSRLGLGPTTLQGKFKGKVDIIGLQFNYKY